MLPEYACGEAKDPEDMPHDSTGSLSSAPLAPGHRAGGGQTTQAGWGMQASPSMWPTYPGSSPSMSEHSARMSSNPQQYEYHHGDFGAGPPPLRADHRLSESQSNGQASVDEASEFSESFALPVPTHEPILSGSLDSPIIRRSQPRRTSSPAAAVAGVCISEPSCVTKTPGEDDGEKVSRGRRGASQALVWKFMMPFSAAENSRNIECVVPVTGPDGVTKMKCGATFKHTMGGSTTNLLKHLRKRHPAEAQICLENSKHSTMYKAKAEANSRQGGARQGKAQFRAARTTNTSSGSKPASGVRGSSNADTSASCLQGEAPANAEEAVTDVKQRQQSPEEIARSYALFCALDLHPSTVGEEPGYRQFMSMHGRALRPGLQLKSGELALILSKERTKITDRIRITLSLQQKYIPFGSCCSLQLDTWSNPGTRFLYAIATVTYVDPSTAQLCRAGLDVQAVSLDVTVESIKDWIVKFTAEYFPGLAPKDAYICCTVGHEGCLAEAVQGLELPALPCKARHLSEAVRKACLLSERPELRAILKRAVDLAAYVSLPAKHDPALSRLQLAMGTSLNSLTSPGASPYGLLELLMGLLQCRQGIVRHFEAAGNAKGRPDPLDGSEWELVCEIAGVLEACTEVDYSIRSKPVAPMTSTLLQFHELLDYLKDDTFYVPELGTDLDSHRKEKNSADFHPAVRGMCDDLLDELQKKQIGALSLPIQHVAAALDVANRDMLLCEGDDEAKAWQELASAAAANQAHLKQAAASTQARRGEDDDTAGPSSIGVDGKRRWHGALSMRVKQRKKLAAPGLDAQSVSVANSEVEAFKNTLRLSNDEPSSAIQWWHDHSAPLGAVAVVQAPDSNRTPLLERMAAQHLCIEASSLQAGLLLGKVGYRMIGLEHTILPSLLETMLFLRLNKALVSD